MNKFSRIGLALSTAVLSLGIMGESPAQAAAFLFEFGSSGQGSLSFTNTPLTGLTGKGKESISLDELNSLAEEVNFGLSYPTIPYGLFEPDDYGNYTGYGDETFHFLNGKLTGMDFIAYIPFGYGGSGGSRYYEVDGVQALFVRNNRFTEFVNVEEYVGGFVDCYPDPDSNVGGEICEFDNYERIENHQIEEEGISYTVTGFYEITLRYFPSDNSETITDPFSESGFLAFNDMPKITFTTTEPVPEPLTILGTGTAMALGIGFKKVKQKKTQ